MKLPILILLLVASLLSAQNLFVTPEGVPPFPGVFLVPGASVTVQNGILQFRGVANEKVNAYQKLQTALQVPENNLKSKSFQLAFQIRSSRNTGSFQVAVREAFGKSSATYHGFLFRRFDLSPAWENHQLEFTTKQDARQLAFYLVAYYLSEQDLIEIRNISILPKN